MKRPFVVLVLAPLVVLLLGVAGYFTWGAVQKRRFHGRLEALRDAGVPTRWEDLVEPVVRGEDNGANLLAEAEAIRGSVEDASMEDIGWLEPWEVESWEEEPDRPDEEDLALAAEMTKRLAPYYAKLDDVLTRPAIRLARTGPMEGPEFALVGNAIAQANTRARIDPTWRGAAVDMMCGLLVRWRAHSGVELLVRPSRWHEPCRLVRDELRDDPGPTEPLLARWGPMLARSEVDVPESLRIGSREGLVQQVWTVEEWGAGRDPFAKLRESLRELSAVFGDAELDEESRGTVEGIDRVVAFGLRVPWQARWWGRPFLWRDAQTLLDRDDALRRLDLSNLDALRTWLDEERRRADWRERFDRVNNVRLALHQVAVTRLARVALAIHDHQLEHGTPPDALDALAERLGGAVPLDPLTGKALRYQVGGGRIFLQVDPQGELLLFVLAPNEAETYEVTHERMEDCLLYWSLPVR